MGSYVDCGQRGSESRSLSAAALFPSATMCIKGATLTSLSLASSVVINQCQR